MSKTISRKVLAVFMAVAVMMAFTVTGAFAASSPDNGEKFFAETVVKKGAVYKTTKQGTATVSKLTKKGKTKTIAESIKISGKRYQVTKVAAKAFAKCKKLKTVQIRWKSMKGKSFSTKAFKGMKKSKIKKIKVRVNKKMSKKDFSKLRKTLLKAGIKKKNIKKNL